MENDKKRIEQLRTAVKPSEFICIQTQQAKADELPAFDAITTEQETQYLQQNQLRLTGYDAFPTMKRLSEISLRFICPHILETNILAQGWNQLSFCQQAAIPAIASGADVLCVSRTGSGKTGAYLIPLIMRALRDVSFTATVVVPSPQLVAQTRAVLSRLSTGLQTNPLSITVQTPETDIKQCTTLIVDECDALIAQLDQLSECQREQTCLFSASLPPKLNYIADSALKNPARLFIQQLNVPTVTVKHRFCFVSAPQHRAFVLNQILTEYPPPAIVFSDKPAQAAAMLKIKFSFVVTSHEMNEANQADALSKFTNGKAWVLFTDDGLARGIDFKNVNLIVQMDVSGLETYLHRAGRAGRQRKGTCVTLYEDKDRILLKPVVDCLKLQGETCEGWSEQTTITQRKPKKDKIIRDDEDGLYEELDPVQESRQKKQKKHAKE